MSANIHASKTQLLAFELEKTRDRLNKYIEPYEQEKKRAVLLQADLDAIDDFNAFVETEVTRSLRGEPS